jgi:hypothetical protein
MLLRWFGFNLHGLSFESRMEIRHKSHMIPEDADKDDVPMYTLKGNTNRNS